MPSTGFKHTPETKEKLRQAAKKQWSDPESRTKLVEAAKRRSTHEYMSDKIRRAWEDPSIRAKFVASAKKRATPEIMAAMANVIWSDPELRDKQLEAIRLGNKTPWTEEFTECKLNELGYEFCGPNHPVAGILVDFYIPEYKLTIEVDGDYWHSFPHVKERDSYRDAHLHDRGYKVLRIKESELLEVDIDYLINSYK